MPRRRRYGGSSGASALVALAALAFHGCGGLGVDPDGRIGCGPAGACPAGLACSAIDQRCHRLRADAAVDVGRGGGGSTTAEGGITSDAIGDDARVTSDANATEGGVTGDANSQEGGVTRACVSGAECATGNCVDGVCCNSPCKEQCQACDVSGAVGTCSPVPAMGLPRNGRQPCGGAPCPGYCDGTNTTSCQYPRNECSPQTCVLGIQTSASTCDANGLCPQGALTQCKYACVANACGGECSPGAFQCSGSILQYCDAGTWQTQATCSGATPKCDANQHKCSVLSVGDACTNDGQCGGNFCSWGVCCSQQCDARCTSSCAGGSCQAKADGTQCAKRQFDAPGFNDINLVCHSGACVAPKIICNDQEGCDLTSSVCCAIGQSASTFACTTPGACENLPMEEWFGCASSADCPTGTACLYYFQDVGARYTECVPKTYYQTSNWTNEPCDPNIPNPCVVVANTTCHECIGCGVAGLCN
jgi:hypothetical protein